MRSSCPSTTTRRERQWLGATLFLVLTMASQLFVPTALCALDPSSARVPKLPLLDTVIRPGTTPLDTQGNRVEAHGGCLLYHNRRFYWFGESKKEAIAGDWLSAGVALYSSPDLSHWTCHGMVLRGADISVPGRSPPFRMERPKVVRCPGTGQWVLYLHLDLPNFWMSSVGVATASSITGPYTFHHAFKPDGLDSYDMSLFQDGNDTYLVRSAENRFTAISALSQDCLATTGGILSSAPQGEGQALFHHDGHIYMLASHLTGWSPNPLMLFRAQLATSPRLLPGGSPRLAGATWQELPAPTEGPQAGTTYNSQPTFVTPIHLPAGQVLLVYMGDRWNHDGPGSLLNASYVWLPLLPAPASAAPGAAAGPPPAFRMPYLPSWRIRDFLPFTASSS